jgi:hypothetical protein
MADPQLDIETFPELISIPKESEVSETSFIQSYQQRAHYPI